MTYHCGECTRAFRDHGPDGECMAAGHYGHHWNPAEVRSERIWVCNHSLHDTERCTPTKHYGRGEA